MFFWYIYYKYFSLLAEKKKLNIKKMNFLRFSSTRELQTRGKNEIVNVFSIEWAVPGKKCYEFLDLSSDEISNFINWQVFLT